MNKHILLLSLILLFANIHAQNDWQWLNPLPQGYTLQDIYLLDERTAIAVGRSGTIIKTTDGGKNWTNRTAGTLASLNSIQFIDGQTGWIAGGSGRILKTMNAGDTWEIQASGTNLSLGSIFFIYQVNI